MKRNRKASSMLDLSNGQNKKRSRSRSPHVRKQNGQANSFQNFHYADSDSDRESRKRDTDFLCVRKASRRSRSNSRDRGKDHHRRSRSITRWENRTDEYRSRKRVKMYVDDVSDTDSEHSPVREAVGANNHEMISNRSQPPNNTIMIRGLPTQITETEIRQDIIRCGLMPKDIRLIKNKDTGASRGFGFVEFTSLIEAVRWMEMKQGVLILQDSYRAIMQYSIPKDFSSGPDKTYSIKVLADWYCVKCGSQNFKRRDICFKCYSSRMESEDAGVGSGGSGSGSDEICTYVTKTIMLSNLDALTTEDSVIHVFAELIPEVAKKISGVCIGRDPLTLISRGVCYLGTENTIDALSLYTSLTDLPSPLTIDEKTVTISYCKYNMGDTKKAHETALNAAFPTASQPSMYSLNDVDSLAEYSAIRYSKNVDDYQRFFTYYQDYFTQQIIAGKSITLRTNDQTTSANSSAFVAQSAVRQAPAKQLSHKTVLSVPTGSDGICYPTPATSEFIFDKNSGFYYDSSTGLHYDPKSTYYWNSVSQKYLYFDPEKSTYLLAPTSYEYSNSQQLTETTAPVEVKKPKVDKQDKIKGAKKVVKDMEKWEKTLNQKKDNVTPCTNTENAKNTSTGGLADIGYSVLEKKNDVVSMSFPSALLFKSDPSPLNSNSSIPLVAAYGESESSDDEDHNADNLDFLDFTKLICNLCKRQLTSADALAKHAKLSDLHKKNLKTFKSGLKKKPKESPAAAKVVYRDRAKERRMKYGYSDEPPPSKLKEKYLKTRELVDTPVTVSIAEPISTENVGNRLLQKMGWTEGQGLGKANQGRTSIIQAEKRNSTTGLGNKVAYTAQAGESYKDCVKKMMYARYQEL